MPMQFAMLLPCHIMQTCSAYGLSTTTVLPLHVYRPEVRRLGSPAVSPNISVQCDAVEQSGHGTHRLALIL